MGMFRNVEGLDCETEVIEHSLRRLSDPSIGIEELTLAVEGLQLSKTGRAVSRAILGRIAPEWLVDGGPVTARALRPLRQRLERGVLSHDVLRIAHEVGVVKFNPFEFTIEKKNDWEPSR